MSTSYVSRRRLPSRTCPASTEYTWYKYEPLAASGGASGRFSHLGSISFTEKGVKNDLTTTALTGTEHCLVFRLFFQRLLTERKPRTLRQMTEV
jgi:hypothetical protein